MTKECREFVATRNVIEQLVEEQRVEELIRQRRLSVTEPVAPTYDSHHSIRIEGTPPPTYHEAKKLPTFSPEKNNNHDIDIKHDGETSIIDSRVQTDNISDSNITSYY